MMKNVTFASVFNPKRIQFFFGLFRWAGGALLMAVLLEWSVANSAPAEPRHVSPKSAAESGVPATTNAEDVQEIRERIRSLEELTRQNYSLELEGQRKKVDWWLTFLGIMLAGLAIFVTVVGIAIPYVIARKNKEIFDLDKKIIESDKAQTRQLLEEVKGMKTEAEDSMVEIHRHEEEAKAAKETIVNFQSGTPGASSKEIAKAVENIEQDKMADHLLKLRAEAVAASNSESAEKAYKLWAALAELAIDDASAQFNAGYWAGMLSLKAVGADKMHWLHLAGQHSARALSIDPQLHIAANNWGSALAEEAMALATTDLAAARSLWQQAGVQYQEALRIKPDNHDAANNWGGALDDEAKVLATTDLAAARSLWQQAGVQYQQALRIKPDYHEATNNWGVALAAEAKALATNDLSAARSLWQQAGAQYQEALRIKPDKHEAANNWGSAMLYEAGVIASIDAEASQELLGQAEQLLLAHVAAAPNVVSYNLACVYGRRGDVTQCLHWLAISHAHKELPDCEHLRQDKDLNAVRNAPEFIEWFSLVCGATGSSSEVTKA